MIVLDHVLGLSGSVIVRWWHYLRLRTLCGACSVLEHSLLYCLFRTYTLNPGFMVRSVGLTVFVFWRMTVADV